MGRLSDLTQISTLFFCFTLLGGIANTLLTGFLPAQVLSSIAMLWFPGVLILTVSGYYDDATYATDILVLPVIVSLVFHIVGAFVLLIAGYSLTVLFPVSYVVGLIYVMRFTPPEIESPYTRAEKLVSATVMICVVLFLLSIHLVSTRLTLSFHGAFHTTLVYNIIQTGIPAVNPGFAWEPIRTYWPFHVLVAVFTESLLLPPVVVIFMLNFLAALGTIVTVRDLTIRTVGHSLEKTTAGILTIILGLSVIIPLYRLLGGAWQARVSTFLQKFLAASGFPLALFVTMCLVYLFIRQTQDHLRIVDIGAFILTAALLFYIHATTALFAFLGVGVGTVTHLGQQWQTDELRKRTVGYWTAAWGVAALLSLIYYLHIQTVGTADSAIHFFPQNTASLSEIAYAYYENGKHLAGSYAVLGPVVLAGLWLAWKQPKKYADLWTLTTAGAAVGAGGVLLFLTDGNQYKSTYIVVLFIAPIAALGASWMYRSVPREEWRRILAVLLVIALATTPIAILWMDYLSTPRASNANYAFDGPAVVYTEEAPFDQDVFSWIRANTPEDSALIFTPSMYERAKYSNYSTNMIFSALSQRSLFYADEAISEMYLQYSSTDARETTQADLLSCSAEKTMSEDVVDGPLYVVMLSDDGKECRLSKQYADHTEWEQATEDEMLVVYRYAPDS